MLMIGGFLFLYFFCYPVGLFILPEVWAVHSLSFLTLLLPYVI